MNVNNATWIVGASSGIGLALAHELARQHVPLVLSARRGTELEKIKRELQVSFPNCSVTVAALDIQDASRLQQVSQHLTETGWQVNRVIINAGVCEYIDSVTIDVDAVQRVMQTNFIGALNVVNASLPLLRTANANAKCSTQLVFVSSSVSYQALPRSGAYGASKAALSYFAEALSLDLKHEGIDVRIVSPGFVKTPLTDLNDFDMPARISAASAAQRIVKGLAGKQFDIHFPKRFTWSLKFVACLPTGLKHWLLGKLSRHSVPHAVKPSLK